ncbi:hypothetical protein BC940DRAFT_331850 [Gongronella butleri]|nr:hypothetical protein BC940DRAFT_331850 [Gongronella butleri]
MPDRLPPTPASCWTVEHFARYRKVKVGLDPQQVFIGQLERTVATCAVVPDEIRDFCRALIRGINILFQVIDASRAFTGHIQWSEKGLESRCLLRIFMGDTDASVTRKLPTALAATKTARSASWWSLQKLVTSTCVIMTAITAVVVVSAVVVVFGRSSATTSTVLLRDPVTTMPPASPVAMPTIGEQMAA